VTPEGLEPSTVCLKGNCSAIELRGRFSTLYTGRVTFQPGSPCIGEDAMEPFCATYIELLQDLHRQFIATFEGLPAEALDWQPGADMNSLCVLVVHTTGSARFWIGIALGEQPERNRDLEFQAKGLSAAELKARFTALEEYVSGALENFNPADFGRMNPVPNRGDYQVSTAYGLLHALEHTGLHLGHAQITRQLWGQR
jgi:uncharacterized damage-inducible protein DinB